MEYALVTGASKGLGEAMARELARRGYPLLLVARSSSLLENLSLELSREYHIEVHFLAADLSTPEAPETVFQWVTGHQFPVSVLINNAGYGLWGQFEELSLEEQNNMLRLNTDTLVNLCYRMLPILQKQSRSYILNVGSLAGFQAVPTLALYSASKALVNTFTRALAHELRGTPVSVTLLAPGGVKTGFVARSGMHHMQETADRLSMTAEAVAKKAINAMFKGKIEIVPGFPNQISALMVRILPKTLIESVAGSLYKKKSK